MIREPFSDDVTNLLLPIVENDDLVEPLKTSTQTSGALARFLRNQSLCMVFVWRVILLCWQVDAKIQENDKKRSSYIHCTYGTTDMIVICL